MSVSLLVLCLHMKVVWSIWNKINSHAYYKLILARTFQWKFQTLSDWSLSSHNNHPWNNLMNAKLVAIKKKICGSNDEFDRAGLIMIIKYFCNHRHHLLIQGCATILNSALWLLRRFMLLSPWSRLTIMIIQDDDLLILIKMIRICYIVTSI